MHANAQAYEYCYQSVMDLTNDSCAFPNEADLHIDAIHSLFGALSALSRHASTRDAGAPITMIVA